MRRLVVFLALLTLLPGCCWFRHCPTKAKAPLAGCEWTESVALGPSVESRVLIDLKDARDSPPASDLQGDFLTSHCQAKWQSLIEMVHCGPAVRAFCQDQCSAEAARDNCLPGGQGHEVVMDRCRAQSVAVFTTEYPLCAGFVLCGNDVEPPGTDCSAP